MMNLKYDSSQVKYCLEMENMHLSNVYKSRIVFKIF